MAAKATGIMRWVSIVALVGLTGWRRCTAGPTAPVRGTSPGGPYHAVAASSDPQIAVDFALSHRSE